MRVASDQRLAADKSAAVEGVDFVGVRHGGRRHERLEVGQEHETISGKRYAVILFNGRLHSNSVDIISSGTVKAIAYFTDAFSVTVNKDLILVAHGLDRISVLKGTQKVGVMNVQVRLLKCKSCVYYFDRWIQQSKSNLFILDNSLNLLIFKWSDIHAGTYTKKMLVSKNVNNYAVTSNGVAILTTDGRLQLSDKFGIDLNPVDSLTAWSLVAEADKYWLVSGEIGSIVSISRTGVLKSKINVMMASNSIDGFDDISIYSLEFISSKAAYDIIVAIERGGCLHMISMSKNGSLSLLSSREKITSNYDSPIVVYCVCKGYDIDELIVNGCRWMKKVKLRLN